MTEAISVRDIEDRTRSVHHSALHTDFETEEDGKVTVRDRDTMEQVRIDISELNNYFDGKFDF